MYLKRIRQFCSYILHLFNGHSPDNLVNWYPNVTPLFMQQEMIYVVVVITNYEMYTNHLHLAPDHWHADTRIFLQARFPSCSVKALTVKACMMGSYSESLWVSVCVIMDRTSVDNMQMVVSCLWCTHMCSIKKSQARAEFLKVDGGTSGNFEPCCHP